MSNNPLQQYFRKPSMYFRLPSDGQYYPAGVINMPQTRELPVFPMTVNDEMTIRIPDGLYNGEAVASLIRSCVPNILDPWQLNNIDLDAVLLAIKAATGDGKMSLGTTCPSCSEVTEYDLDLLPMIASLQSVNYDQPLAIGDLTVKFRPLTYAETNSNGKNQFEIQKVLMELNSIPDEDERKQQMMNDTVVKLNELIISIVSDTIEYIATPETRVTQRDFIVDFLNNCDRNICNLIKETSVALREQSEIKPLDVVCPHCKHEYQQKIVINATDFFD